MKFILSLIIFAFLIFFPIHCTNPYQPRSFSRAIAVMPSGEHVCESGRDTIDIWCPYNNKVSASLRGHRSNSVTALVILPNGNLASGSRDKTIKIWNPNLEQNVALMRIIWVGDEINALVLLQSGDLASGSSDAKIKIWNPMNGTLLRTLTGHSLSINALVCLNNGFLASGSRDKTIKIWNPYNGTLLRTVADNSSEVVSLAILKNGNLASGHTNGQIKVWNPINGGLLRIINGHQIINGFISLVSFPNGNFASAPDFPETEIKIWNHINGNLIMTLKPSFSVQALAIGNGNLVIKEYSLAQYYNFSPNTTKKCLNFTKIPSPTNKPINGSLLRTITNSDCTGLHIGMVVLVNGNIACVSRTEVKIWNPLTGELSKTLKPNESWYMNKHGAYLASLTNGDLAIGLNDYIEIWNPSRQILLRTLRATSSISTLACLPNGDLASGVYPNLIAVWNPFNGTLLRTLSGRLPIKKLAILSNGYIAGAESSYEVKIWNPYDGKLIQTLKTQSYSIMDLATLPNEQIAIGLAEKMIQIWDSMKGVLLRTLTGQVTYHYKSFMRGLTELPNGDLATGVGDGISIWNPNSGELMKTLGKYLKDVENLILSKNGDLASGHSDGTIKIWKM